jgi:hypothetical protein
VLLTVKFKALIHKSVTDSHHFDMDPDPDPAFHFDLVSDPIFPFDADPDPSIHFFLQIWTFRCSLEGFHLFTDKKLL